MEFREVSGEEWGMIGDLLPPKPMVGGPRFDEGGGDKRHTVRPYYWV